MNPATYLNQPYTGANKRNSSYDLYLPEQVNGTVIIFIHGYMGFKDWGCWKLVADFFVSRGFAFLKYNVSHNGCTPDHPTEFTDLEAFSMNSYRRELDDLDAILNLVSIDYNFKAIYLIGHSRGGGIALLQGMNPKVSKIVSWAGIASISNRFPEGEALLQWKKEGVRFQLNGRTGQNMPLNYSQYTEFDANRERLDIKAICLKTKKPVCLIHGENDEAVTLHEGELLAEWLKTKLHVIPNTGHTFDSTHPWLKNELPLALKQVCEITLTFLNEQSGDKT